MRKNKWIRLLIWIIIIYGLTLFLKRYFEIDFGQFSSPSFLFNYLGVLLGFALTLYTFIISQHDSISSKIDTKYPDPDKNSIMKGFLNNVFSEVGDDVRLIFYSLVIVVFLFVFKNPILELHIGLISFYESFLVMIFILSIMAIKDLISVSFSIGDILGIKNKKHED